jgi:hypothetical protein
LTKTLIRGALLDVVRSLGNDIDWFTILQFIDKRILADKAEPYGGLPHDVGIKWLKEILPQQKETLQGKPSSNPLQKTYPTKLSFGLLPILR